MAGPRVVLFYEDATVGGPHGLVRAISTARRKARRKQPFSYFAAFPRKGNARLVRDCGTFADVRFRQPHRADRRAAPRSL